MRYCVHAAEGMGDLDLYTLPVRHIPAFIAAAMSGILGIHIACMGFYQTSSAPSFSQPVAVFGGLVSFTNPPSQRHSLYGGLVIKAFAPSSFLPVPLPPLPPAARAPRGLEKPALRGKTIADLDVPMPPRRPNDRLLAVAKEVSLPLSRPVSLPPPKTARPFGDHVAVYDISAHAVYLPDGTRLEAHSGRGSLRDNPRGVATPMRGATPPATYALTPREDLFHGVAALRLTPIDGNVYGRVGLLAHTYMLGPYGDSFGCVSFRNYDAFLRAYRKGAMNKLVVVSRL